MRLRAVLFWSAAALFLVLLAFDLSVPIRIQGLEARGDLLSTRYTALNRELQAQSRKESAPRADPPAPKPGPNPPVTQPDSRGAADTPNGHPPADAARIIALNPELRAQYLKAVRGGMAARWPILFDALHLPPEESDRLSDLMAQRIANNLQIDEIAAERGLDPTDPAMRKINGQLSRQNDNAVAALLGPDAYATYQQYSRENGVAPMLVDFAGNLPNSSLTLDQAEQLSHAMAASSQIDKYGFATYGTIDVDQAMSRAAGILTPDQLPILNAVLQKNRAYIQSTKLTPSP